MGGKAFHLDDATFPRIPSPAYVVLKERFASKLKTLYKYVETPIEAPEKIDHGDIDFLVCEHLPDNVDVLSKVQSTLGARHANLVKSHTSSFAVPAEQQLTGEGEGAYYQVDVHEVADEDELRRTHFFHSYGDMGMILGVLARPYGFSLGTKGLKTHYVQSDDTRISSFQLSSSVDDIMSFFTLDMETYRKGFKTRDELFTWLQTSRFFMPQFLIRAHPAMNKVAAKNERVMYEAFFKLCEAQVAQQPGAEQKRPLPDIDNLREEALAFFGKKEAYDELVRTNVLARAYHEKFNGKKVMAWTGLYGIIIKNIMAGVRERLSREEIAQMDEESLRALVLEAKATLPAKEAQQK